MQILRLDHLPGFWHSRRNVQGTAFYLGRKGYGTRSWTLPESKGQVVRVLCWGRGWLVGHTLLSMSSEPAWSAASCAGAHGGGGHNSDGKF